MNLKLLAKMGVVAGLSVLAAIPIDLIHDSVEDREAFRDDAVEQVGRSFAGAQRLGVPVLVIPYTDTVLAQILGTDAKGKQIVHEEKQTHSARQVVYPRELEVKGNLDPSTIHEAIFDVLVYVLQSEWTAKYEVPIIPPSQAQVKREWGTPYLAFLVADPRGIRGTPQATIDGQPLAFEEGVGLEIEEPGIRAQLNGPVEAGRSLALTMSLKLAGSRSLGFIPLGDTNKVTLTSTWPHPGFHGNFLPRSRDSFTGGFTASWEVTALNTDAQLRFAPGDDGRRGQGGLPYFGVGLIEPGNTYQQVDRATKYGILFILITFAAFFLFEVVARSRIHPVQYVFVGFALAVFFLLLLAFSERLDFHLAYGLSAFACAGVSALYLGAILGWRRGLGFGGMLVILYGTLFGVLLSEENGLLLGSGLVFMLLAAAMMLTRRIDWYEVGPKTPQPLAPSAAPMIEGGES